MTPPVVHRAAARVVLVGPGDSVLLFSGRDPGRPETVEFWFTPGGGVEPGETVEAAARREVREETGILLAELGPVAWRRRATFEFEGRTYSQEESFFVVRSARTEVRPTAWTDVEARSMTGWRWWPLRELTSTGAVVYPAALAPLVSDWLAARRA